MLSIQSRLCYSIRKVHTHAKPMLRTVRTDNVGFKAVANVDIPQGTVINYFSAPVYQKPSMHTVMLKHNRHIEPTHGAECILHACVDTNTRIIVDEDYTGASFIATRDVQKDEDLTFNYNTTEWDISEPFICQCSSCAQKTFPSVIRGFKHLSSSERSKIIDFASPAVLDFALAEFEEYSKVLRRAADEQKAVDVDTSDVRKAKAVSV